MKPTVRHLFTFTKVATIKKKNTVTGIGENLEKKIGIPIDPAGNVK